MDSEHHPSLSFVRIAVGLVVLAVCQSAAAQAPPAVTPPSAAATTHSDTKPTASAVESARNLMDIGYDKFDHRDFAAALVAFRAADSIMHVTTTGLAVGRALIKLDSLLEARDALLRVSRIPVAADESLPLRRGRREAEKLQRELADKIPSLHIALELPSNTQGVALSIDGTPVPRALIGQPQKMNPGRHRIELRATGHEPVRREFSLAVGQQAKLVLRLAATAKPAAPLAGTSDSMFSRPLPTMSTVGFGVAGAALIVGGVTGGLALSAAADAKAGCDDNGCPLENEPAADRALVLAHTSTVSFAIAGVAAAVGMAGLVLPWISGTSQDAAIVPTLGWGSLGLRGRF
jgi:hypothetical protein